MSLEDLFTAAATLNEPSAPADVAGLVVRRRRDRRRARLAVGGSVLAVVLIVAGVTVATTGSRRAVPAGTVPAGWSELPASPLSPRRDARTFSVGTEAFFVGGWAYAACPVGGPSPDSCVSPGELTDGAAYDLTTGAWRRITPAPSALGSGAYAVVGSTVYMQSDGDNRLVAYDVATDRWQSVPQPTGTQGRFYDFEPTAAGGRLFACYTGREGFRDQVLDASDGRWSEVPADPFGPSLLRSCASTGQELVALSTGLNEHPSASAPSYAQAAVLDPVALTWRRLPGSTVSSTFDGWTWDGSALVNPNQDKPYGGPLIGGGRLDVQTGTWSLLPPALPEGNILDLSTEVRASGERFKPYRSQFFDSTANAWIRLPQGPDAVHLLGAQVWVGDSFVVWGGGTDFGFKVGPKTTEIASTGGIYQQHATNLSPAPVGASAPVPTVTAVTDCPGPNPCQYSLQPTTELRIDGQLIKGRINALDGGTAHDLDLTVTVAEGVQITRYWFGESSGAYGSGPNGPTGVRYLRTGEALASGSHLRLSWKPALTGHRYLVLIVDVEPPGGRGAEISPVVGEFQISP